MMISKSTFWRAMRLLVLVSIAFVVIINEREWLAVLPAALLHEAGHYIAARLCGAPTGGIRMDLLGARIEVRGILSYGKEFAVACGGPVMNLLSAAMVFGLQQQALLKDTEALSLFFYASLGLGLLNLLPVGTLDGGRMLSTALSGLCSPFVASICLRITTTLFLVLLWLLAVYALLWGSPMISAFIFILTLLFRYTSPDGRRREV